MAVPVTPMPWLSAEADETWPRIVEDAARGELKDIYAPVDAAGKELKPSLKHYPVIPWDTIDLKQFNSYQNQRSTGCRRSAKVGELSEIVPVESGRGCPYGCEFCTVTGFFGDSIRFRTNESVVNELLLFESTRPQRARTDRRLFHRRQFRHQYQAHQNLLLRDIIAAGAQVNWVAQISANLLRDQELVDLISASGGKWVFIGMESIDPAQLERRQQRLQQAGRICRRPPAPGTAQRLCHHFLHLRHG